MEKLGAGGFGQVYKVEDLVHKREMAMKCEPVSTGKCVLKMEVAVLKELRGQPGVPNFYGCGRTDVINFVVMSLLGENLSSIRKRMPKQKFSPETVCELALQAVTAIQCVHEHGVLHRDIKPSNFALGKPGGVGAAKLYILDFGLSRIYRMPDGTVRPPRKYAGFRGTARYAGMNAHNSKEQCRADDLWSLYLMMVEGSVGK
jgi:tau tubulin kinase